MLRLVFFWRFLGNCMTYDTWNCMQIGKHPQAPNNEIWWATYIGGDGWWDKQPNETPLPQRTIFCHWHQLPLCVDWMNLPNARRLLLTVFQANVWGTGMHKLSAVRIELHTIPTIVILIGCIWYHHCWFMMFSLFSCIGGGVDRKNQLVSLRWYMAG